MATRTAEISGVLARTTGAMRPEKRAEIRDPRPLHRSPRACCAAVMRPSLSPLAPPAERTTQSRHIEGGLRVSCACELEEASSRHAARRGCAGRPVRLRQSAPPLCTASASAGAAFRCPGAAENHGDSRVSMRMLRHACEKLLSLTEAEIWGSWNWCRIARPHAVPLQCRAQAEPRPWSCMNRLYGSWLIRSRPAASRPC